MGNEWCVLDIFTLALIYSDLYLLGSIETDNGFEFTGAMLNRVCTQIVLVLGILLIFRVVDSLTPKHFKLLNYLIVSILPLLVITDFLIKQYWNQSLITVVNLLTSSGSIDLEKEIVASGVNSV